MGPTVPAHAQRHACMQVQQCDAHCVLILGVQNPHACMRMGQACAWGKHAQVCACAQTAASHAPHHAQCMTSPAPRAPPACLQLVWRVHARVHPALAQQLLELLGGAGRLQQRGDGGAGGGGREERGGRAFLMALRLHGPERRFASAHGYMHTSAHVCTSVCVCVCVHVGLWALLRLAPTRLSPLARGGPSKRYVRVRPLYLYPNEAPSQPPTPRTPSSRPPLPAAKRL